MIPSFDDYPFTLFHFDFDDDFDDYPFTLSVLVISVLLMPSVYV